MKTELFGPRGLGTYLVFTSGLIFGGTTLLNVVLLSCAALMTPWWVAFPISAVILYAMLHVLSLGWRTIKEIPAPPSLRYTGAILVLSLRFGFVCPLMIVYFATLATVRTITELINRKQLGGKPPVLRLTFRSSFDAPSARIQSAVHRGLTHAA